MQVRFGDDQMGQRWAWSEGLRRKDQLEIAVGYPRSQDNAYEGQVARLLKYLGDYLLTERRPIRGEETIHYGWTTLRFKISHQRAPGMSDPILSIEELRDPMSFTTEAYIPGVAQAVELVALQENAIRRNRISGLAGHPHRMDLAIICSRAMQVDTSRQALVIERSQHNEPRDSGWILRCDGQQHDHNDPTELDQVHLLHVASACPFIFQYLAMPVNTTVVFTKSEVVVFPPHANTGYLDSHAH